MTIYLMQVFLILVMSAGFHPADSERGRKTFLFLSFALLTVVSGIMGPEWTRVVPYTTW